MIEIQEEWAQNMARVVRQVVPGIDTGLGGMAGDGVHIDDYTLTLMRREMRRHGYVITDGSEDSVCAVDTMVIFTSLKHPQNGVVAHQDDDHLFLLNWF